MSNDKGKRKRLRKAGEETKAPEVKRASVRMKKLEAPAPAEAPEVFVGVDPAHGYDHHAEVTFRQGIDGAIYRGEGELFIGNARMDVGHIRITDGNQADSPPEGGGRVGQINADGGISWQLPRASRLPTPEVVFAELSPGEEVILPTRETSVASATLSIANVDIASFNALFDNGQRTLLDTIRDNSHLISAGITGHRRRAALEDQAAAREEPSSYAVQDMARELQNLLRRAVSHEASPHLQEMQLERERETVSARGLLSDQLSHYRVLMGQNTTATLRISVSDPRTLPAGTANEIVLNDDRLMSNVAVRLLESQWTSIDGADLLHDNESYILVARFMNGVYLVKQFDMRGSLVMTHTFDNHPIERGGRRFRIDNPFRACKQAKINHIARTMQYAR